MFILRFSIYTYVVPIADNPDNVLKNLKNIENTLIQYQMDSAWRNKYVPKSEIKVVHFAELSPKWICQNPYLVKSSIKSGKHLIRLQNVLSVAGKICLGMFICFY